MNNEQMSPEERLLEAIFKKSGGKKKEGDKYPEKNSEKIGYALYLITRSLESISPALTRLSRLDNLYKMEKLPEIIAHNEARMALDKIVKVKQSIDDAYNEVLIVFKRTKEKEENKPKE